MSEALSSQQRWLANEEMSTTDDAPSLLGRARSGLKSTRSLNPDNWLVGAAKQPGVEVWRIEKMVPVLVPLRMHGQFYEGDSYIICKTVQPEGGSAFEVDIFFWLGEKSSQDERGVAAYKTVELDESLGGGPVQHREVQGHESDQFMHCFPKVEYLKGGVASGFRHVELDVYEPRLLHVKGLRRMRVSEKVMSHASLNAGDVFILDLGMSLLQWNGSEANRKEKVKAIQVCTCIKNDERGGKATIDSCDQGWEPAEFWTALGGKGPIAPATPDAIARNPKRRMPELHRVVDASGGLEAVAPSTPLTRGLLETAGVFLMDNEAHIFVWVGKGASAEERKAGMRHAQAYAEQRGRPPNVRVMKVMEGTEPVTFQSNFVRWATLPKSIANANFSRASAGNVASPGASARSGAELVASLGEIDALKRHEREERAMLDDSNGTLRVYRLEDFSPVLIDESLHGLFHAGDSYIVEYTYVGKRFRQEHVLLYFWLGRHSTKDEKASAAMHVVRMDQERGGKATEVRVVQGKEPSHFVRLFKGRMVIHAGGKASGFKNRADADEYDKDGVSLFHVRGTGRDDTRAVQVEEKTASLNSGDCFVLRTPTVVHLWEGSGANEVERAVAKTVAEGMLGGTRSLMDVSEGAEPPPFWDALGGQGAYPSERVMPEGARAPMLFACSNATGTLEMEPVYDFGQADLCEADVYVLDSFTTVFVWVGTAANDSEKRGAREAADAYIEASGYDADTPIMAIKSGDEPSIFTCHFLGWDSSPRAAFVDPYEARLGEIRADKLKAEALGKRGKRPSWIKSAVGSVRSSAGYASRGAQALATSRSAPSVLRPVMLRPNQSPNKPKREMSVGSPTGAYIPMGPVAIKRPPVVLKPVSLRPNQAPTRQARELGSPNSPAPSSPKHGSGVSAQIFEQAFEEPAGATYTFNYDELKKPVGELPKGVDPRKREQYLADDEFVKVLGTPRAEFLKLKGWKQTELKRKAGLF